MHEQGRSGLDIIQFINALREKHYKIGKTGEFVIARKNLDSVEFLLSTYEKQNISLIIQMDMAFRCKWLCKAVQEIYLLMTIVVWKSWQHIPMCQPHWGIVAKITVSELNNPYFEAKYIAVFICIILILFFVYFFIKVSDPVIKRIADNEEHNRSLFYKKHVCMLVIDTSTLKITDANPAACKFYGYSHNAMVSMYISEINEVQPDERIQSVEKIESGRQNLFDAKQRLANGRIRDVEIISGVVRIKGRELLYSIIFDITDRKQIEEELIESRELFQKTFQFSLVANALAKFPERIMVDLNDKVEDLFSYNRNELIGKPISDFDIWKNYEERRQAFQILTEQGRLRDKKFSFKTRSGAIGRGLIYAEIVEQHGEKYRYQRTQAN